MKRGKLVGEPTAGSTGDPLAFALPGGGAGRVSTSTDAGPGLIGRGV
jgi:carboxyl-terminal processing protease